MLEARYKMLYHPLMLVAYLSDVRDRSNPNKRILIDNKELYDKVVL